MNMVDSLQRKKQKADATEAARIAVQQIATGFNADADWQKFWFPHYLGALIGDGSRPRYQASDIAKGVARLLQSYEYPKPPKPADLVKAIRAEITEFNQRNPQPGGTAQPRGPKERRWTPEQRARNVAFMDAINAMIEGQNADPEYIQALRTHGKGSPELAAVVKRQRTELQAWINQNKPTN